LAQSSAPVFCVEGFAMRGLPIVAGLLLAGCDGERAVMDMSSDNIAAWSQLNPNVDENTWKGVGSLECSPSRVDVCKPGGCAAGEPKVRQVIELATNIYKRCEGQSCDSFQGQASYAGAWANFAVPESAMFLRVTANDEYYEVVTLMDMILIYRGKCQRVAPLSR